MSDYKSLETTIREAAAAAARERNLKAQRKLKIVDEGAKDTEHAAAADMRKGAEASAPEKKVFKVVHKTTGRVRGVHDNAKDAATHHNALSDKSDHKVVFEEVDEIIEGWKKHPDGTYSADMSDMAGHYRAGGTVHCPKCRHTQFDSERVKDKEGEVTHHLMTCRKCDAKMKVFNDEMQYDDNPLMEAKDKNKDKHLGPVKTQDGKKRPKPLTQDDLNNLEQEKQHMQAHAADQENQRESVEEAAQVKGERGKQDPEKLKQAEQKRKENAEFLAKAMKKEETVDEARFDADDYSDRKSFDDQRKARLATWKKKVEKREKPEKTEKEGDVKESYRTRSADSKVVLQTGTGKGDSNRPFWKRERARYIKIGVNPVGSNGDEELPSSLGKPGEPPAKPAAKKAVKEWLLPTSIEEESLISLYGEDLWEGAEKEPLWKTWTYLHHRMGTKYKALDPSMQPHVNALHKKLKAAEKHASALEKNPSKIRECFHEAKEWSQDDHMSDEDYEERKRKAHAHKVERDKLAQALSKPGARYRRVDSSDKLGTKQPGSVAARDRILKGGGSGATYHRSLIKDKLKKEDLMDLRIAQVLFNKSLEDLEEGRGRPRKNPDDPKWKTHASAAVPEGEDSDRHIHVQLKSAADNKPGADSKGGAHVHFGDGSKHFVKHDVAHAVVTGVEKLRPDDREKVHAHIAKSHENLMAVHAAITKR